MWTALWVKTSPKMARRWETACASSRLTPSIPAWGCSPAASRTVGAMSMALTGVSEVRGAGRHAVREPAAAIRAAPPLARLEAEVALLRQEPRQGRHVVKVLDHLLPMGQERRISRGRALVHAGGQRRVVAGDLVLVR